MYQAILFATDGDFVTDYERDTIDEVVRCLEDTGSRWYFYQIAFVITSDDRTRTLFNRKRIIRAFEPFAGFEGRTVLTVRKWIVNNPEMVVDMLER